MKYFRVIDHILRKSKKILKEEGFNGFVFKVKKKISRQTTGEYSPIYDSYFDLTPKELTENFATIKKYSQKEVELKTVNWFIPYFGHAFFGGIYTIFRFMDYLRSEKGVKNRLLMYDSPTLSVDEVREKVAKAFPDLAKNSDIIIKEARDFDNLPESDAAVATFWNSSYSLARFNKTKRKLYFVQDYEPLFYTAGTEYALAEATYRFGFWGLVNTPGLEEIYKSYTKPSISFTPAVDRKVYYPAKRDNKKIKIFFYGRPGTDRNAFLLGIEALRRVKSIWGEKVDLVTAGSDWKPEEYRVKDVVTNLGLLKGSKEVADLYRTCHIGLVFMLTKHPSYQPFEFMASGMATVTNHNASNLWLLKDGENCLLTEPTISCEAESIGKLIEDEQLRERIAQAGFKVVEKINWEEQLEKLYQFIVSPQR